MLQRAAIVAATAHRPPLVVADEPTSALDAERAGDVLRLLRERSRALLVVTHDPAIAARCDRRVELTSVTPGPTVWNRTRKPGAAVVELAGATLTAGRRHTVAEGADLTVRAGEIVGVVGPSGAGKTTLLHT